MEKNIQYKIVTFAGADVEVNICKADNIFEAAEEIRQSIAAGDIKIAGVPIQIEDVAVIEDIEG